jgi:hypothetical protein
MVIEDICATRRAGLLPDYVIAITGHFKKSY